MKQLWHKLRPLLANIGLFSLCINVLCLAPAMFMLQVFDRVLPTNSQETLLVLLAGTVVGVEAGRKLWTQTNGVDEYGSAYAKLAEPSRAMWPPK